MTAFSASSPWCFQGESHSRRLEQGTFYKLYGKSYGNNKRCSFFLSQVRTVGLEAWSVGESQNDRLGVRLLGQ